MGEDRLGGYADIPIALRSMFTYLPVEIYDPPLGLRSDRPHDVC